MRRTFKYRGWQIELRPDGDKIRGIYGRLGVNNPKHHRHTNVHILLEMIKDEIDDSISKSVQETYTRERIEQSLRDLKCDLEEITDGN